MKRYSFSLAFFFTISLCSTAQIYTGKTYKVSFFSDGPVEDISAVNKSAQAIMNTAKNEIAVKVTIKGFDFEKKLMQEHFNEKYMESDKYPYATFAGKINDSIDFKKDGVYKVSVSGKLSIHGVEKENTLLGIITVKGGEISLDSKFMVALKDYNIDIPSLVAQNISELIEVTVKLTLTEYKQK
jgi:polyisoprenoid-binding protein YceI